MNVRVHRVSAGPFMVCVLVPQVLPDGLVGVSAVCMAAMWVGLFCVFLYRAAKVAQAVQPGHAWCACLHYMLA
jgi:hypothetical protein